MAKKYRFQRNKKKTLAWLIGIAAVIAAVVIGVAVYNSTRSGEFDVPVPASEQLNNIAANLDVLTTHTDKFYAVPQEDGSTTLQFLGSEHADTVVLYVNHGIENYTDYLYGTYMLPSIFTVDLSALTSGQIDMSDYQLNVQTGNENVIIHVEKYPCETKDAAFLADILAEIEAIIAQGPVVTEEAPADEAAETPAE